MVCSVARFDVSFGTVLIFSFCCFSYCPFWFGGQDFGSGCASSWPLLVILAFN